MSAKTANLDEAEVARFGALAAKWWDVDGEFRPLHLLGRSRLRFIRDQLVQHFGKACPGDLEAGDPALPLAGLRVLDIGCGGGLVCEPLCRMGAQVTGIDPAEENVSAARAHARIDDLDISYEALTVEALCETGQTFDAVVCLEVIEHVPEPQAFLQECAKLVRPGGMLVVSTINRTLKSYALAIVAAEYILDWVPRGTHDWQRFVTADELRTMLNSSGLSDPKFSGLSYDPAADTWKLSTDSSVNYLAASTKPSDDAASF